VRERKKPINEEFERKSEGKAKNKKQKNT